MPAALRAAGVEWREVAPLEWGLEAEAGGAPLHVGMAVRDGVLRAQAEVLAPGLADPAALLHRNRSLALVRFASTRAGAVWVVGDLPASAAAEVDGLLARLVAAADDARAAYAASSAYAARRRA